jgi:hypothetical protein
MVIFHSHVNVYQRVPYFWKMMVFFLGYHRNMDPSNRPRLWHQMGQIHQWGSGSTAVPSFRKAVAEIQM